MTDPRLKEGMLCPVCRIDLLMTDRQGVEVDYCPRCRGVWLDRGELDKIIERSASAEPERMAAPQSSVPPYPQARGMDEPRHRDRGYREYDDDDRYRGGRRKKKSWLGDMFDFD